MKKKTISTLALLLIMAMQGVWAQKVDGLLSGEFSVSATRKVSFSKGNLQAYFESAGDACTWRFADNQWDYVGNQSANISINGNGTVSEAGAVDLFGWVGKSSKFTGLAQYGISNSTTLSQYINTNNMDEVLKSDWGNTMGSGWRTLTRWEWDYLLQERTTTSNIRYARAKVNDISGIILLPDDWDASYHSISGYNNANAYYNSNVITSNDWASDFEAHGAVFLPAGGYRHGSTVYTGYHGSTSNQNSIAGNYWSSTKYTGNNSLAMVFSEGQKFPQNISTSPIYGCSVRLVQSLPNLPTDESGAYLIGSLDDWNTFCNDVNEGCTYSGKTVKLTANIEGVSNMAGTSDPKSFQGTFDGQGLTLTLNISTTADNAAPFRFVNGGATIQNLHVAGTITTTNQHAGGIVAVIASDSGTTNIINCKSSVIFVVNRNGDASCGGLVACSWFRTTVNITGCTFTGSFTTSSNYAPTNCAGFIGYSYGTAVNVTNLLMAPSSLGFTNGCETFARAGSGTIYGTTYDCTLTINNSYHLDSSWATQGLAAHGINAGDNVSLSINNAPATYDVAGITAYGTCIKYDNTYYAGNGESVSLNLSCTPPEGYALNQYVASAGTLTGDGNPYTLVMPDDTDVTISATLWNVYTKAIAAWTTEPEVSGWYLIASPIGTVNPLNVANMTNDNVSSFDLYRFNQNPSATLVDEQEKYLEWENWKKEENVGETNHYHFDLEPGKGYLYANSYDVTLSFTGTPYDGEGVFELEYSDSNPDSKMWGWNLVGNPFAETAYVDKVFYRMNYGDENTGGNEIILAENNTVEPMEGVFVYTEQDGESVTFTPNARSKGHIQKPEPEQIVLNLSRDRGSVIDRAIVRMGEGQTLPKFQIRENSTKLYIPQGTEEYAIVSANGQGAMPVNFRAKENGTYTLNVNPENVEMSYLHLIDNMTGADVDLLALRQAQGPATYTFNATTRDYESRFKLVFSSICEDANGDSETFAFFSNGNLIVSNEGHATLQVVDIMGRILSSETINGSTNVSMNASPGIYIIRLINGNDVKVQKMVVR